MTQATDIRRGIDATPAAGGRILAVAGALLAGGFVVNAVFTLLHPAGEEDNHPIIFAEYAADDAWVAVHFGQFFGILAALAGLLALYGLLRARGNAAPVLGLFAAAATVVTATMWAVLFGLDGIGLKQAVDAWAGASGPEQDTRLSTAEGIRWLEWGFQGYFRVLLGVTLVLFGVAILRTGVLPGWLGTVAVAAGALSAVMGVDVGYSGLASGLQDVLGLAFLVVALVFAFGVLAAGMRGGSGAPRETSRSAPAT